MTIQWVLVLMCAFSIANAQEGYGRDNPSNPLNYNPFGQLIAGENELSGDEIPGEAGRDYPVYAEPPQTSFRCDNQQFPGYYADPEAQCQAFYICQKGGRSDSFLCPNGTVFNQEFLVCDWWYNFDCNRAESLYSVNEQIVRAMEEADERIRQEKEQAGYDYNSQQYQNGVANGGYQNGGSNGEYQNGRINVGYQNGGTNGGYKNEERNSGYQSGRTNGGYQNNGNNGGYKNGGSNLGYPTGKSNGGYQNGGNIGGYQNDKLNGGYQNGGNNGRQISISNIRPVYGVPNTDFSGFNSRQRNGSPSQSYGVPSLVQGRNGNGGFIGNGRNPSVSYGVPEKQFSSTIGGNGLKGNGNGYNGNGFNGNGNNGYQNGNSRKNVDKSYLPPNFGSNYNENGNLQAYRNGLGNGPSPSGPSSFGQPGRTYLPAFK